MYIPRSESVEPVAEDSISPRSIIRSPLTSFTLNESTEEVTVVPSLVVS